MLDKWNACCRLAVMTSVLILCLAADPKQIVGCLAIWGVLFYLGFAALAVLEVRKNLKARHEDNI